MTDFIIECYNVSEQVYATFIYLAVLIVGALNLAFGWVRWGRFWGGLSGSCDSGPGRDAGPRKVGANLAMALLGQ
jgi:hypothetical protein